MIIDLAAINKLAPPGLLNLAILERLIAHLLGVVEANMHRTRKVLKLSRLIGRLAKQYRGNVNYNLNVRIRAWVLGSDSRRAQVRAVIGEATLRRWHVRYGASLGERLPVPVPVAEVWQNKSVSIPKINKRPYAWKNFALVNVAEFSFQGREVLDIKPIRQISTNISVWTQPREPRVLKPAEFWPHELEPEYGVQAQNLCTAKTPKQACAPPGNKPKFKAADALEKPPPDNVQAGKAKPP